MRGAVDGKAPTQTVNLSPAGQDGSSPSSANPETVGESIVRMESEVKFLRADNARLVAANAEQGKRIVELIGELGEANEIAEVRGDWLALRDAKIVALEATIKAAVGN